MVRWFALDSTTGRFIYRRADLKLATGKGKSPWAAAGDRGAVRAYLCQEGSSPRSNRSSMSLDS